MQQIESNLSKTPLIVMTADRPNYLINKGENQTINQTWDRYFIKS